MTETTQDRVDELQSLLDAALRLLYHPLHAYGWNPETQTYGYYLVGEWVGETMLDLVKAEAARHKEQTDERA